jgi:hypothetical protein
MNLNLVYYIYINPDKYKTIVNGQLHDIIKSGIPYHKIYICICSEKQHLIDECKNLIDEIGIQRIVYSQSLINQFEYPGLKLLYDLSHNSNDIFLYIHSKGMVYNNKSNGRNEFERTTLRGTLHYHQKAMEIFKNIVNINKVGLWPSDKGFIWVNFFYIRGGYLKKPPIITQDRWWYEEYIGSHGNSNYFDCYSLIKDKVIGLHPDLIKDDQLLINQIDKNFDTFHDNDLHLNYVKKNNQDCF